MAVVDIKNLIRQLHLQQKMIQRLNWKVVKPPKTSTRFCQHNLFLADFPSLVSIKPQFYGSFYLQKLWAYLHLPR